MELYLEIFFLLTPYEVVKIKYSSRALYHIVSSEEEALFSFFLRRSPHLLEAFKMYRSTVLPKTLPLLNTYFALKLRVDIVDRLLRYVITDILNESFRMDAAEWSRDPLKQACFDDVISDIRPYMLLLGHFLEVFKSYFGRTVQEKVAEHSYAEIRLLQSWILRHYTPYAAQRVTLVYRDLMRSLGRKLRPPSYANRTERTLRGWTHDPAKPEDCRDIAIFGGLQTVWRIISMTGYNNRMRATDRFLTRYLGRVKSVKPDEFSSQITQPLDRDMARLIRPCLKEFRYFLPHDAKDLAALGAAVFDRRIYMNAGFGCKVFTEDYQPDEDEAEVEEESVPLIADPPRHGCDCDAVCGCGNKEYLVLLQKMSVLHEESSRAGNLPL